jgi:hypothetical protein
MILIYLLVTSVSVHPEYYTNTNFFYEIIGRDSIIYGATSGGLVSYNYLQDTFRVLNNTDGLQMNKQNCLGLDSTGYIWVGNQLGLALVDKDFSSVQTYPIECLTCTRTQEIVCLEDSIYVGSSGGLLFINTNGTPADFSDDLRMKIYVQDGLPSNNVLTIAIDDTLIWVGTDNGLAHFTKDFSTYVQYDTVNGLLSKEINKIAIVDTSIYVATELGLNSFKGDHFDTLWMGVGINDISYLGDSIILALDSLPLQVAIYHQGDTSIINDSLPYRCRVMGLTNAGGELFCGLGNQWSMDYYGQGIGMFDLNGNSWHISKNRCLPSNHISDIAANEYGVFVGCGRRANESRGIGWLKNSGEWINFSRDSVIPVNRIHRCTAAPDKKIWFCVSSVLLDVIALSYDPLHDEWNIFNNGYHNMDNTNSVWDLEVDNSGNIYLLLGLGSNKLWVIDSALNGAYALEPIREGFYVEIAVDSTGKIWRTMVDAGLIMTDTKNTLFNSSDDDWYEYSTSDNLISNYARGCVVDADNNLYVATEGGLAIYDGERFSGISSNSLQDLFDVALDSEGRVWMLARDGIFYYDPEFKIVDGWEFSELNVHIDFLQVSNEIIQIQGFEFDPYECCFWIGGETGLLKLAVQYDTLPSLDSILIYPNPVLNKNIVRIKNIPTDARVNIYAISGRLVEENLAPDNVFGEVVWRIPENVGSGIYYVLVRTNTGNKICKFAIVK